MLKKNVQLDGSSILVTGAAGFIGASLTRRLLDEYPDCRVIGIDNITDYYDVRLKHGRLERLRAYGDRFVFFRDSIADRSAVDRIFGEFMPSVVVNLAAQAGVRYSITNPDAYIESNIIGFYNILEACRHSYDGGRPGVGHLVYASSSSVYGANRKVPYSTDDMVDNPISLYAATKKSDELLAHAYSKLYDIPSTGLRFFTVYGPCGRPGGRAPRAAVHGLQHRQQLPREPAGLRDGASGGACQGRGASGGLRLRGTQGACPDAARGRACDVRRHRPAGARLRLQAIHSGQDSGTSHSGIRSII